MLRNLLGIFKIYSEIKSFFSDYACAGLRTNYRRLRCEGLEDRQLLSGAPLSMALASDAAAQAEQIAGHANFNSVSNNLAATPTVEQAVYSVQKITDTTTGNIEYQMWENGFHFGTLLQSPQGAIGFRGHPNQSDIDAWGTTVQENVFIAGAGVDATGGVVNSAVAGSSGIQVSAGGNVPSASGTVGTWSWSSTITYDFGQQKVTLAGTTTVTLAAALSGDMNIGRDDSNYLYNYPLNGGGVGTTGDMKSVTITYGPDSNVSENQWTPLPGSEGTSPQDASDDVTTTLWGQINRSDPNQVSIAKPTVEREIASSDPTTKLIVACNWDFTEGYQYDNVGVEQIVRQQNTSSTNFTFDNTETWTLPDATNPTITADPLATNTRTPVLTGTVNPSSSGKAISNVMVVVWGDQGRLTLAATVNGTAWSLPVSTPLPNGMYDIQATATDTAGNTAFAANILTIGNGTPVFTLTAPTSGIYAPGQPITITWAAGFASNNSVISLCLDQDTTLWNGNERWIEVDKVTAATGIGSYTFDPGNFLPGAYYIGGYMYDKATHVFTNSHLTLPITIPKPTFTISSPTSGTFAPGQTITIDWTVGNVSSNSVISLCLDQDARLWNGSEKWIEVDKMTAVDGTGTYTFDPGNFLPGTYYVGGYVYDKKLRTFTEAHAAGQITIPAPTFTITGPASETYVPGQDVIISWIADNVSANSVITLCLDQDTALWNGNERWVEVDKVAAANGTGSYTFDPGNFLPGTYYVGGYVYDKTLRTFTEAHAAGQMTIPAPTFQLTAPVGVTVTAGQQVTISWNAGNVESNSVLSLCYDTDTTLWNRNDHWIEVDKVPAANGSGSHVWDTTGVAPGTYYIGGYMYDKVTHLFTDSHLMQSFTIVAASSQSLLSNALALAGDPGAGAPDAPGGTDGASLVDNTSNLAIASKDLVFGSAEPAAPTASRRITGAGGANNQDRDELLAANDNKEELSAIDAALRDQDAWLEEPSPTWVA